MGNIVPVNSKKSRNIVTFESIEIPDSLKEFVSVQNGVPTCTSIQIAEKFGMEHFNLLVSIKRLIANKELTVVKNFNTLHLQGIDPEDPVCMESEYVDESGRKRKRYTFNESGFMIAGMAIPAEGAKEWRKRFVKAFRRLNNLVMEEANRKIMQLTKPQEAVWIPVFNEFDKKIYKVLAPMDNYTDAQRLVIRKANAIAHARSTIANAKKWEKEYLGGEAMNFMPSVCCEVDKDGNFIEVPKASELKIARLPKLPPDAFKRTQWSVTAIKKK